MIKAIIFDLDGTVLDNEGIWEAAFAEVAEKNNLPKFVHTPGIGVLGNWKNIVKDLNLAQKYSVETREIYMASTITDIPTREGLIELVEQVKEMGWQTALATGSEWVVVEKELEQLNLYLAFDITTTGEEVLARKPDPEIYLLTCQKMGLEPDTCVVIEDSLAGVESARDAGCLVMGIANSFASKNQLEAAGAKLVVDNFSEVMLLLRQHGDENQKDHPDSDQTN